MLKHISLTDVLCLDIETVPQFPAYHAASEEAQQLWDHKAGTLKRSADDDPAALYARAGIYAEFGKIICISAGALVSASSRRSFNVQSYYGHDERKILEEFAALLNIKGSHVILCAHNGREFDFPYLCRRMIINGIPLPAVLQITGKKPWEIPHIDTMELWKFGDYKHYTPLNLLARILGIESPKNDISGSDVHTVYWEQKDLERIVRYCEKDAVTVMQILLKMQGRPLLSQEEVTLGDFAVR